MKDNLGLVHIYCGDGKGKTTAVTGLAVRAAGCGLKVLFFQLMKTGTSGELNALRQIDGIDVESVTKMPKFTFDMTEEEKLAEFEKNEKAVRALIQTVRRSDYDLLIVDEAISAIHKGILSEELVEELIRNKPEHLELVLSGRKPPEAIVQLADYVSEVTKIKHPMDEGIMARKGIEF